jgi:hypothetical protein
LTRMVQDVDTVHSKISLKVLRRRFSDWSIGLAFHIKRKGGLTLPSVGILTVRGVPLHLVDPLVLMAVWILCKCLLSQMGRNDSDAISFSRPWYRARLTERSFRHGLVLRMKTDLSQFQLITHVSWLQRSTPECYSCCADALSP